MIMRPFVVMVMVMVIDMVTTMLAITKCCPRPTFSVADIMIMPRAMNHTASHVCHIYHAAVRRSV